MCVCSLSVVLIHVRREECVLNILKDDFGI